MHDYSKKKKILWYHSKRSVALKKQKKCSWEHSVKTQTKSRNASNQNVPLDDWLGVGLTRLTKRIILWANEKGHRREVARFKDLL